MNDDELLIATIEDKQRKCEDQNILTHTAFLDGRQSALAATYFRGCKHKFYGGYDDAERRILVFLPDYYDDLPEDEDPLTLLRVNAPKAARQLEHRDYLGSILGLKISRDLIGDIIVYDHGADIIIQKSIADFLLLNYSQAGNVPVICSILPLSEINLGEINITEKRDTVASLRLDNVLASVFNLSRGKAQEAIKLGIVFLNNRQCLKPDESVQEGDKIVLRGKGKAILKEVGGESRKGRTCIVISRYN